MSWLWWLLAAIVIALLLWWLLADSDDDVDVYDDDVAIESTTTDTMDDDMAATGTTAAAGVATLASLNPGDDVDLEGLRVASVVGDMSFMATDSSGEEVMVVFNQEPTPGTSTEGEFDINEGMTIDVTGRVLAGDEDLPDNVDASIPTGADKYIFADSLEVAERSATPGTTTAQ